MFWAVTLSSASSIFRAKEIPLMRGDIAKVTCPSTQVNDQTGGYQVTSGQRLPRGLRVGVKVPGVLEQALSHQFSMVMDDADPWRWIARY
jgi:hypothetical protein